MWPWYRNWGSAIGLLYKIQWAGKDFYFLPPSWTTTVDDLRNTSGAQKSPSDPSSFEVTSTVYLRNEFCPRALRHILLSVIPAGVSLFYMRHANVCWGKAGRVGLSLQVNALTERDIISLSLISKAIFNHSWNATLSSKNDREYLILKYPTAWAHGLASTKTRNQIKSPTTQTNVPIMKLYGKQHTSLSSERKQYLCKTAAKAYLSLSHKSSTSTCRRGGPSKMSSRCSPPLPDKIRAVCTS